MKIAVFPGDAMSTFLKKGEWKERYYNQGNMFDEVHLFTFVDSDISGDQVKAVGGSAKVFVHALGKLSPLSLFTHEKKVIEAVKQVDPDVIRSFTPTLHGFLAAKAAKALKKPFVVSIHGDFDLDVRYFYWRTGQYRNWLQSTFMQLFTERFAISSADRVICAYAFPMRYAKEYGAKNISLIYNKVYAEKFDSAKPNRDFGSPTAICVGRLIPEKNQECLIQAIALLDNVNALIIGNGPQYDYLVGLAKELGVLNRVFFEKGVPNKDIPSYYKSCQVFALPIKYGGVAIPVIEAMAAGLPVLVARPELDPNPEIAGEVGMVLDNTPRAFADAIKKVLSDDNLRKEMFSKGKKKFAEIEGRKMEEKERKLYEELIASWK
ncbi:glycosyltransferase family 4 protein [Candidatus Micrarchaeota archaeon]|nr:glycosyltransferase family 4 protein [Candidatus Micrarchaeota archaeon]